MRRTADERALAPEEQPERPPELVPEPAAAELLALHRGAGNRAVAAMLVARDAKAPAKPKAPEKAKAAIKPPYVDLPGVGVINVESAQFSGSRHTPGGNAGPGHDSMTEMTFSSKHGEHSSALFYAAAYGRPVDAEVVLQGLRIKLHGALVVNYSDRKSTRLNSSHANI